MDGAQPASLSRAGMAPATVLFAILVAHAILETARDALFLSRLGPEHLASAYLAMAACAVVAVVVIRRVVQDPRGVLIRFLACAVIGTAVIAVAIASSAPAVFVLYVWTGFIVTLVVPSFWTALDRISQVGDAKRTFGTVSAGGVLGAITGSAIAGALGRVVAAHHLVTAGALAFALATLAAATLLPKQTLDEVQVRPPRAAALSRRSRRYVALLLVVGLLAATALTLGDLTFKRVIAERLSADSFATVFGAIYTGLNAIALAIQLLVTPRLLARWGVGVALAVLPLLVVATATGFALTGALVAVIALKLGDGGLRHSLHRVSNEILYLPVPAVVRDSGKLVADAIGQRGGQAIAALAILALAWLGMTARGVAAVAAVAAAGWLVAIAVARRAYGAQLREMLEAGEIQRNVTVPQLDAESTQLLTELVTRGPAVEALAALDLLAQHASIPTAVFDHPHEAVVRHALALLDGNLPPDMARLREHPDPEIRAAALTASIRARFDAGLLERARADADPHVRAAALVGLTAHGRATAAVDHQIAALVAGSTRDRMALVSAIGFSPGERFRPVLHALLAAGELAVTRQVLHVLANHPALAELDRLLGYLADPRLRGDARRVFVAVGRPGLDRLLEALDDSQTPPALRRHLPRTISRFGSAAAAAALVARLARAPDASSEFKILRALGGMRTAQPRLAIDLALVHGYVRRAIADAARYATFRDQLERFGPHSSEMAGLIGELLTEKRRTAIERAFRGLGIAHPSAGLRSVHDALTSGDPARRGAAREIVEIVVDAELRPVLLATVDDVPADERRARLGRWASRPYDSYEQLLAALLVDPSESLRCMVAYHVADQNLVALRAELERLRPGLGRPFVIHAFDQAMARLDG